MDRLEFAHNNSTMDGFLDILKKGVHKLIPPYRFQIRQPTAWYQIHLAETETSTLTRLFVPQ